MRTKGINYDTGFFPGHKSSPRVRAGAGPPGARGHRCGGHRSRPPLQRRAGERRRSRAARDRRDGGRGGRLGGLVVAAPGRALPRRHGGVPGGERRSGGASAQFGCRGGAGDRLRAQRVRGGLLAWRRLLRTPRGPRLAGSGDVGRLGRRPGPPQPLPDRSGGVAPPAVRRPDHLRLGAVGARPARLERLRRHRARCLPGRQQRGHVRRRASRAAPRLRVPTDPSPSW